MMSFTQKSIQLTAGMEAPKTRAGLTIQGSNFDEGEEISVYINGKTGTEVCNPGTFIASAVDPSTSLNTLSHTPQLYYPVGDENVDIKAYYPSFVTNTDRTFTVKTEQGEERDYKNSDLMYAEKLDQKKTSGKVNLLFSHKMVKFVFNVEGDGPNVSIGTPYLTQVKRTIGFDGETGELSDLPEANANRGDVQLDNGGAIIIPPQTISGSFIGIEMSSERDSETRTGTATFSLSTPKELHEGKVYTVNIVLGHDNLPAAGQTYTYPITKWDDDAGVISIAPAGTTGIGVATPDDTTYTGEEFKPKPEVRFGEFRVLTEGTDYEYQYFNNVHGGKAIVLVVGKGDYTGFSVATSFTINPATASLSYASDSQNWREGQEQGKVNMKYTYNGVVDNPLTSVGEVTTVYDSSNPNVAIVNQETGQVILKGIGTTKITADMAASDDWTAAHAEYELTVTGRSAEESASDLSVELDYHGQTYVYDGHTQWKPGVTVKDKYNEGGETKETVVPSEYYQVWYPDSIGANEAARVIIDFLPGSGSPYTGSIEGVTYAIAKANPNLTVTNTDMYIAIQDSLITEASRSRTVSTNYGDIEYSWPDNTGAGGIAIVTGSNNQLTIVGKNEGDFILTLTVPDNTNWVGNTVEIPIHVVRSKTEFSYTGYSQRWKAPAKGTYLLEVWGAQGGGVSQASGGYGAKVQAKVLVEKDQYLFVNVGQKGLVANQGYCPYSNPSSTNPSPGNSAYVRDLFHAWNGGGAIVWGLQHGVITNVPWWVVGDPCCGGGGATDISLEWKNYNASSVTSNTEWNTPEHMLTRIIVAGGGGGALYYTRETGTANGTNGGAWEAGTMTITGNMTDPGEGGKINMGGNGGIATDRSTYAAYTVPFDGRPTGWSGSNGIFGDGGYWYCVEEGGGAGGGGWYGGGAAGQSAANGSGAGGSSYAWTDGVTVNGSKLSAHYPTASSLANDTYYSMYKNCTVQNPNQRGFQKLTEATAVGNGNGTDDAGISLNGRAKITCISISE